MSRSLSPIEHGTVAGWWKHRRRGIPHSACNNACRDKWNERSRTKRREKRER